MKDYYYILGVKPESSFDEIKTAYRKLSIKFHPDKNNGDEFFSERFKEINEAYEIISDYNKRIEYDIKKYGNSTFEKQLEPEILQFESNKTSFYFGDEIIIKWKTTNAEKVILKPFGATERFGEKRYKIKDYKSPDFRIELVVTNGLKKASQIINLENLTYKEMYLYFKEIKSQESTESDSSGNKDEANVGQESNSIINRAISIVLMIFLFIAVIMYFSMPD